MKATINTNLFAIISVGMYGTVLEPDSMFDSWTIDEDKSNGDINYDANYFWEHFNNQAYVDAIESTAHQFLNGTHEANGIEVKIRCKEIYSPKYYNFSTDEMVMDVTYNKRKVKQYAKDYYEDFYKFLKDNYSSRDGFCSMTANNYNDWLYDFNNNEVRAIGAVLSFIFKDDMLEEEFYDTCRDIMYYWDFIDYKEYDEVYSKVWTYVKENYMTLNKEKCPIKHETLDVASMYKDCINKVEEHNLKLKI